jgi:hypothetical protein
MQYFATFQERPCARKFFLKYVAVICLFLGLSTASYAQMGPDYWAVTGVSSNDHLNIRSGPGSNYRVVALAPNGAVFRNLGCQGTGNSRWCHLETPTGDVSGWASGRFLAESGAPGTHTVSGDAEVPELHVRNSGEYEVRFASGCTVLFNPSGNRINAGSSCSQVQLRRAHDAVDAYVREQGGTSASNNQGGSSSGANVNLQGSGTLYGGSRLTGSVIGHSEGHYAVVVTSTDPSFVCTGVIQHTPGTVGSEMSTLHCTDGASGVGTLARNRSGSGYTFPFTLGSGNNGYLIF